MPMWQDWFTALKQQTPIPWTHLSSPPKKYKRHLENIPMIRHRDTNGFPPLPSFLTPFQRYENIFITFHCCQVSWKTRSSKSTPFSLPTRWIFISYQSKSRKSTKISTNISSPDIFGFCISSRFGGKWAVHAQPSLLKVHTQKLKSLTCFSCRYLSCSWRQVIPFICKLMKYL